MDGSPAVRLGDGALSSLSHNGRLALSQMRSQPTKFLLLPTGIGELRKLDASGLVVQALESDWMPDDQGFYFVAAEPGHSVRTFRMLLDGSKPTPVTAEGYAGVAVSPDGKTLVVRGPEQQLFLYDLISGKPHPLRGSKLGEQCINWNESGRGIYVTSPTDFPVIIDYLDIATGQRKLWKTILPSDLAGAGNPSVHITPKGDAYVYSVSRTLSDLYLVEGLH
jgi:WD40 repeat protein